MKLYHGKWYLYVRKGDLAVGFGRLPESIKSQIDRDQPHYGV